MNTRRPENHETATTPRQCPDGHLQEHDPARDDRTWLAVDTDDGDRKRLHLHLRDQELPPGLIVAVTKHIVAVIDGVIHDTHDCSQTARDASTGTGGRCKN